MFTDWTFFIDECCRMGVLWLHNLNWLHLITLKMRKLMTQHSTFDYYV